MLDVMVILIFFLIFTAVFSKMNILELNLPVDGGPPPELPAVLELEVIVRGNVIEVADRNTGLLQRLPHLEAGADYEGLSNYLRRVKIRFPEKKDATVLLEADIPYDTMVQTMDTMKAFDTELDGQPVRGELFPVISVGDAPMAAAAQDRAAMISARLRQNRKVGGRGRSRSRAGGSSHGMSSLIPMIDMLMILVVYLLVHAADYEILPNMKSIQIPQSMSETKPRETVTVLITKDTMFVNGAEIASVADLRTRQAAVIEPLKRVLVAEAGKRMLKDKDDPTSHEVTVLADKDLPYSFLKTILSTCTAAEYGKVSLAVIERERAYSGPGAV